MKLRGTGTRRRKRRWEGGRRRGEAGEAHPTTMPSACHLLPIPPPPSFPFPFPSLLLVASSLQTPPFKLGNIPMTQLIPGETGYTPLLRSSPVRTRVCFVHLWFELGFASFISGSNSSLLRSSQVRTRLCFVHLQFELGFASLISGSNSCLLHSPAIRTEHPTLRTAQQHKLPPLPKNEPNHKI